MSRVVLVLMDCSLLPEGRENGWNIAANHLLSRAHDKLQSALVLSSGSSVPDGDGGGEDGLTSVSPV